MRCFVYNIFYFSVGLRSRHESCSWCSAQVLSEMCRFNVLSLIRSNRNLYVSDSFKQKYSSLWFVKKEIFLSLIRSNRNILVSNSFNQKSQVNIGCIHSVMRSLHLKNDTSMSHCHEQGWRVNLCHFTMNWFDDRLNATLISIFLDIMFFTVYYTVYCISVYIISSYLD